MLRHNLVVGSHEKFYLETYQAMLKKQTRNALEDFMLKKKVMQPANRIT